VGVSKIHLRIVLRGIVKLSGTIELIDAVDKVSGEAFQRNGPLIARANNVVKRSAIRDKVDVFLIRLPAHSALVKETRKVQLIVLVADLPCATRRGKGIVVIENAKIRAGFRPDVIWLRRVNV